MSSRDEHEQASSDFLPTQWSVVLGAQRTQPERARAALERLCNLYWYPLYAFIRRRGHDREDAVGLTQSFFADLLGRDALSRVCGIGGLVRASVGGWIVT